MGKRIRRAAGSPASRAEAAAAMAFQASSPASRAEAAAMMATQTHPGSAADESAKERQRVGVKEFPQAKQMRGPRPEAVDEKTDVNPASCADHGQQA